MVDLFDTYWPTDNDWEIPTLDLAYHPDACDLPVVAWGSTRAKVREAGTLHFYTDDYRFTALWKNPQTPLKSRAVNIIEPNFTVNEETPRAVTIWLTYKKRWLSRFWQSQGRRIYVDLNVNPLADDLNLLGVPAGWFAYATRGYQSRLSDLDRELAIALNHSGRPTCLYLVYGGGRLVRQWCLDHAHRGAFWVPEAADTARGRYLADLPPSGGTRNE